jgi:dipeptidyl aminopeptidase/acylaminoacyl peptidase
MCRCFRGSRRNTAATVSGILLVLCTRIASAESGIALPPVADFFRNPHVADAQLAPSGRYVAILRRAALGRTRLSIVNLAEPGQVATTIAPLDDVDVHSVHWITDDRLVFDIIDWTGARNTANGGLFAVDRDGSHFVALIAPSFRFRQDVTGTLIHSRELPATYTFFSGTHDGSGDVIVAENLFHQTDPYNIRATVLSRLNTRTREIRTLTIGQPPGATQWLLDADDAPRIATAYVDSHRIVYQRGNDSKQWIVLGDFDRYTSGEFIPQFLGFDSALYAQHGPLGALFRFDLARRRFDERPVLALDGFDASADPVADYKAHQVLGYHYIADAERTTWLDPRFAEYQKRIDAALPNATNTITCGHCLSSRFLLVKSTSDRQPAHYLAFDPTTGKLLEIGAERPWIKPSQMGERELIHYSARDGLSIPAYVTLPPDPYRKPFPLIVMVHGGPFVRGDTWEWDPEAQFLASRGYAVIQPEYRGTKGFGFEFFKAGWHQWGLAMQDDLADAAQWATAQGIADRARIAIVGGSYGGYASLMGLIKNPEIFRCAVDWFGVTDIDLIYSVSWSDASEADLRYGEPKLVGDPVQDAEQLKATSPLRNADRITQPVLMAYGSQDRRVPMVHGQKLRSAIGTPRDQVEWVVYSEEGHGLKMEQDRIDFWTRVEKFLAKYLASPTAGDQRSAALPVAPRKSATSSPMSRSSTD